MKQYTIQNKASHVDKLTASLLAHSNFTGIPRDNYHLHSLQSKCEKNEQTGLFDVSVEAIYTYESPNAKKK